MILGIPTGTSCPDFLRRLTMDEQSPGWAVAADTDRFIPLKVILDFIGQKILGKGNACNSCPSGMMIQTKRDSFPGLLINELKIKEERSLTSPL